MADRKIKDARTGEMFEAETVDIEEISEKPMIIKLADGSILRLKVDVVEVARYKDRWDQEGHPMYNVRSGTILAVLESSVKYQQKS